jgi:hypothetical protein
MNFFLDRRTALLIANALTLSYFPIDYTSELIENYLFLIKKECPYNVTTHLFPLDEAIIAFEPIGWRSKPNVAKSFGYLSCFKHFWEIIENACSNPF